MAKINKHNKNKQLEKGLNSPKMQSLYEALQENKIEKKTEPKFITIKFFVLKKPNQKLILMVWHNQLFGWCHIFEDENGTPKIEHQFESIQFSDGKPYIVNLNGTKKPKILTSWESFVPKEEFNNLYRSISIHISPNCILSNPFKDYAAIYTILKEAKMKY